MSLRSGPFVLACFALACASCTAARAAEPESTPGIITTRHALFVPGKFGDLPGWREERFTEAWQAFRQTCAALASRPAWADPCKRASGIDPRADADIRRFLETEFVLYEIRNADRSAAGMITGYYEPLLNGSRHYAPPYAYPVYAVPENLLMLDARAIPPAPAGAVVLARIEGRNVVPVCVKQAGGGPCAAPFTLDLGDAKPDVRDKRMRVRRDGTRIVPYYTRREIEKGALAATGVIAWVDSLGALYSMQVQGSGKVRTPDGQILRLAFAEQNGHPFTPPVKPRTRGLGSGPEIWTRGLAIPLDDDVAAVAGAGPASANATPRVLTRGLSPPVEAEQTESAKAMPAEAPPASAAAPSAKPPATGTSTTKKERSPEVERMIARLLEMKASRGGDKATQAAPATAAAAATDPATPATAAVVTAPSNTSTAKAPVVVTQAKAQAMPSPPSVRPPPRPQADAKSAGAPTAAAAAFTGLERETPFSNDPSFVFFRQIPDAADAGPVGALGVPLTPGRSVAVDPRTTPLGAPVFISTEGQSATTRFNRLMFAQDTGGAIRGAVRADFFWGFGPNAFAQASRMRESGRMWLLLPKDLRVASSKPLTRGIAAKPGGDAECLVPDPEFCVE